MEIRFDREKLKSVVHFICSQCAPEQLGNVKLHKILYFADMLHFKHTGRALTGVKYTKQQFGPVARHLTSALAALEQEGSIEIRSRDYFGFTKRDYIVRRPLSVQLANEEAALLHDVMQFVIGHSAREISELSHNVAWETAKMGEEIPYFSVWGWAPSEVTDADIEEAKQLALRIGPDGPAELAHAN
jgi:uncharacterized phage-associated protein